MSWCPKCKNEYRAGIAICPDCKESLVEELTEDMEEFVPLFQTTDEELKQKIVNYLIHCGRNIKEDSAVAETENGQEAVFAIFVSKGDYQEAMTELRTVVSYDIKEKTGEEEVKPRRRTPEPSTLYVDAKERYNEYKSTGIMFLVFAVLLVVFGVLNVSGMISFMASTASLVIIFGAAAGFLYVGITSLLKTSSLKEEANAEEQTTETIMTYLKENFSREQLLKDVDEEITGEMLYFQLMETMKDAATDQFPEADENYLDALLEEYYNSLDI